MKQHRLISLNIPFYNKIWDELGFIIDGINVEIHEVIKGQKNLSVILISKQQLKYLPKVTNDGLIVINDKQRQKAEHALESFANVISVIAQCKRKITSPFPCFALEPETSQDDFFLRKQKGIKYKSKAILGFKIEFPKDFYRYVGDRFDGYSLMAEGISSVSGLGKFNEFFRLFERAFTKSSKQLVLPLYNFLTGTDFIYTKSEVENWVVVRHKCRHADTNKPFLKEYQVLPIIQRVQQAAFDVLLNKKNWRSPSVTRRDLWKPRLGTSGEKGTMFTHGPPKGTMDMICFDDFGVYPQNLAANVQLPNSWFFRKKKESEDNSDCDKMNIAKANVGDNKFEVNLVFPEVNKK